MICYLVDADEEDEDCFLTETCIWRARDPTDFDLLKSLYLRHQGLSRACLLHLLLQSPQLTTYSRIRALFSLLLRSYLVLHPAALVQPSLYAEKCQLMLSRLR